MGIAWGFDGANGTEARPTHKEGLSSWARDESVPGAGDGTRLTASIINRIVGNIRQLALASGNALTETSDADLANCINALIANGLQGYLDTDGVNDAIAAAINTLAASIDASKAPIDSPAFTGTPTTPTASPSDNSQKIASTAYVDSAIALIAAVVSGALVFKGSFDASSGAFPGSGSAKTGWFYKVSVAGTVDGVSFSVGDDVFAIVDNASTSTYANNWLKIEGALTSAEIIGALTSGAITYAKIQNVSSTDVVLGRQSAGAGPIEEIPCTAAGRAMLAAASAAAQAALLSLAIAPVVPQGRLSLATGVPVMTSDVTAGSTVYYTPYLGQYVPIYDGSLFKNINIGGELSQATTDTTKSPAAAAANSNYDMFVWDDGGTYRCTRGPAWASDSSRGTGAGTSELQRINGILTNKNAITNGPAANRGTYVGTIRTNASSVVPFVMNPSAAAGGNASILGVYNAYNRLLASSMSRDSTSSWSYASATWRQANGNANNSIKYIDGLGDVSVDASYICALVTNASSGAQIGINRNAVTVPAIQALGYRTSGTAAANNSSPHARGVFPPLLGFNSINACEASNDTNSQTFYGSGFGGSAGQTQALTASLMI